MRLIDQFDVLWASQAEARTQSKQTHANNYFFKLVKKLIEVATVLLFTKNNMVQLPKINLVLYTLNAKGHAMVSRQTLVL